MFFTVGAAERPGMGPLMSKTRTKFVCQSCGLESPAYYGRCPDCGAWGSLVETVEARPQAKDRRSRAPHMPKPSRLGEIASAEDHRRIVPIGEFNRVLGGGLVPGSLVLLGGDPGIGKCVTADTRVLDPLTGAYLPITTWASGTRSVLAVDDASLRLGPAPVGAFHKRGRHLIVEMRTALGRTLRCTPDHPVLTPDGWRPVGELGTGSRIAAPRALPYFGDEVMSDAKVKLIAYILSDGSAQSSIGVTNALPEIEQDLTDIAAAFGMRLVRYRKRASDTYQYRFVSSLERRASARLEVANALRETRAHAGVSWQEWARRGGVSYALLNVWRRGECAPSSVALQRPADAIDVPLSDLVPEARDRAEAKTLVARMLKEVGLRYVKATEKAVPDQIFRLPRKQLALFLKILFSCDGSVYGNGQGQPGVSYSTISRRLAQDVQHLLLRFGLVGTLRTKRSDLNGRAYQAYEIVLLGVAEVQRFLKEIGILGPEAACLQIASLEPTMLPSTRRDTIPTGALFWQSLNAARGNSSFAEPRVRAGVTIRDRRHERPLARSTVARLADVLNDPLLTSLAHGDIYWDTIVSIAPAGEEEVYDLSVPGRASFVANDLVVHNSTLLLQVACLLAPVVGRVLYVSAEESVQQIKLRADRLGLNADELYVLSETNLERVLDTAESLDPGLLIVDSIQTVYLDELTSSAGSVSQVRECTSRLMHYAKPRHVPVFIVGHVTKEGAIAGPRVLEHMVDAVLYLEGDRYHQYRVLRGVKNRFGSTDEVGVFEMATNGMREVANPSEAFLQERADDAAGSAVAVTLEGTRPILVEVQALTSTTALGLPRRSANGFDANRLQMLVAVLSKRVGLGLGSQDVYVNVVGGLRVAEPAVDLGVAVAVASSYRERPVQPGTAVIGEVGLSGELRSVNQLERRLNEAAKLGFSRAVIPSPARKRTQRHDGIEIVPAMMLAEAIEIALSGGPDAR